MASFWQVVGEEYRDRADTARREREEYLRQIERENARMEREIAAARQGAEGAAIGETIGAGIGAVGGGVLGFLGGGPMGAALGAQAGMGFGKGVGGGIGRLADGGNIEQAGPQFIQGAMSGVPLVGMAAESFGGGEQPQEPGPMASGGEVPTAEELDMWSQMNQRGAGIDMTPYQRQPRALPAMVNPGLPSYMRA